MKVNIAVCGKFHFANYVGQLAAAGVLGRFYFSHRRDAVEQLDFGESWAINFPLKEYLVQAHGRLLGAKLADLAFPLYGLLWSRATLSRWQPADILHFMAHGHEVPLVERARSDGATILAEAVNTHPDNQRRIQAEEAERWGLGKSRRHRSLLEQRLIDLAAESDRLLVPSETVRRSYVEAGFPAAKIVRLPYAANVSRFSPRGPGDPPLGSGSNPLKVICVGQISFRKGQLYLLEAARLLGSSVVDLTLVGVVASEVVPALRPYVGSYRHRERVSNTELRGLLLEHDVFVLTSLEEGLAVSVCEALACGLAVVTTRESGGEEVINDGETGFFVEARSAEQIAERLLQLHRDRDLVQAIGNNAAEATRQRVNWQQYTVGLLKIYQNMMPR